MDFLVWLEGTSLAAIVRTVPWVYPAVETAHYVGLAFLVGAIVLVDLRLLGYAKSLPLAAMISLLPWVWVGFAINLLSGSVMFVYGATGFAVNPVFQLKMGLMALAGINALIFTLGARRSGAQWIETVAVPASLRGVATASLVLWVLVVTAGRWMAYV